MYTKIITALFLYIGACFPAWSQQPDSPAQKKFFLTIVTPATRSTGILGHIFILVQNPHEPLMFSRVYNYNKFYDSHDKAQVALNAIGAIPLEMEIVPFSYLYKLYANIEDRSLFLHELSLTSEEAENLYSSLEADKNEKFPYSIKSNCVTRIIEHINSVVSENKKIPFNSKADLTQIGVTQFLQDQNTVISRFPMKLMKILEKHPLVKKKDVIDSSTIKVTRTFVKLENNVKDYSKQCGWKSPTTEAIQKSFYFAYRFPQKINEYLIPYARLANRCGLSINRLKEDFLSLVELLSNPDNQLLNSFFKNVEQIYAP